MDLYSRFPHSLSYTNEYCKIPRGEYSMKFFPNLFDHGIFTEKEKNVTIPELNL